MIIKNKNRKGSRSVCICKNCGQEFSELDFKIKIGRGKFCCNDCYKAFRSKNKKDAKELNRLYQKKFKYKLEKDEYLKLFDKQNNKCAICGKSFDDAKAVVDHDHNTNQVRGLLCGTCNSLLGMAHDNIQVLENAIKYLKINAERMP